MYREGVVTDQMCKKWFAKFRAGDVSLDYAPWSGRTVEVDSNQIEILIENNQHSATCKIADILKISKSITLLVEMKNVSFTEKMKQSFWPTQHNSWRRPTCWLNHGF